MLEPSSQHSKVTDPRRRRYDRVAHKLQTLSETKDKTITIYDMGALATKIGDGRTYEGAVMGSEKIMKKKAHGTSSVPVQEDLRWGCDRDVADRICNFNRHYAEHSGYFKRLPDFLNEADGMQEGREITFYDSNSGKPLFYAPRGRTMEEFLLESRRHGWPSFRDNEVEWENVRVLRNGETVSVDGTHLGHDLPDKKGNRYCINVVCVAGRPVRDDEKTCGDNANT